MTAYPHLGQRRRPSLSGDDLAKVLGRRPRRLETIVAALHAGAHPTVTPDQVEVALQGWPPAFRTRAGWVNLLELADGLVLTHALTTAEHQHGVLNGDTDLALWAQLAHDGLPLAAGGGQVRSNLTHHTGVLPGACMEITGPPGWLAAFPPVSMIGLRLRGGRLSVHAIEPADVAAPDKHSWFTGTAMQLLNEALQGYLRYRAEDPFVDPGRFVVDLVVEALLAHPELRHHTMMPVQLLLKLMGFDIYHSLVTLPGAPLVDHVPDDEDVAGRVRVSARLHALHMHVAEAEADLDECYHDLHRPEVLRHVAERVERHTFEPCVLTRLREAATTPRDRAIGALLAARHEEHHSQPEAAEALVTEALSEDPRLHPALLDAADYAATRGNIHAAQAYLRRAQVRHSHPLRASLTGLHLPVPTQSRRNQPCPCGSGRKHKACCLVRELHPLPERVPLVYARLVQWFGRPSNDHLVSELFPIDDDRPEILALKADLAIFEAQGLRLYLDQRGEMLPADERELLGQWLPARLAPYEVVQVRPGESVTLRPLLGRDGSPDPIGPSNLVLSSLAALSSLAGLSSLAAPNSSAARSSSAQPTVSTGAVVAARLVPDGQGEQAITLARCFAARQRKQVLASFEGYSPHRLALLLSQPAEDQG